MNERKTEVKMSLIVNRQIWGKFEKEARLLPAKNWPGFFSCKSELIENYISSKVFVLACEGIYISPPFHFALQHLQATRTANHKR